MLQSLLQKIALQLIKDSFISIQPWRPGLAGTRAPSCDRYGSGTLHPGQVLGGSLPLLSPLLKICNKIVFSFVAANSISSNIIGLFNIVYSSSVSYDNEFDHMQCALSCYIHKNEQMQKVEKWMSRGQWVVLFKRPSNAEFRDVSVFYVI